MKLPNGEQAEISTQKLIGYCLNPEHPSGKHKARVFGSILGITLENPDVLREFIQTAAVAGEVVQQSTTQFGQQFKRMFEKSSCRYKIFFYPTLTLPDILGSEPDFLVSPLSKGGLRGVIIPLKSQLITFQTTSKVDWIVPDTDGIRLRTIWETTANNPYPRLITAFLKLNEQN